MKRVLVASYDQVCQIGNLVDELGSAAYRDSKREAGLKWDEQFSRLYRLQAETVIGIMKGKLDAKAK